LAIVVNIKRREGVREMSIIEMIILTLIAIIGTNAVAWFMIWQQVQRIEAMLENEIEAGRVVRDVKFADEVVR
jgi:hypothetical protein